MNDAQRHELFVKLNKVSVLIAKNANKIERGKDLTREDWKEAAALFNDCMVFFIPRSSEGKNSKDYQLRNGQN